MAKNNKYENWLFEKLKDHDQAVAYLNDAQEDSLKGDEESQKIFLIALRNVAEAQGGIGALAKKAHVGRENLYKTLSGTGNLKWHTLVSLVTFFGLNLRLSQTKIFARFSSKAGLNLSSTLQRMSLMLARLTGLL